MQKGNGDNHNPVKSIKKVPMTSSHFKITQQIQINENG